MDGFRVGGAVTLVTAPAAEPGDGPGERGFLMRVLQLVGFAFEGAVERAREIQLVRSDNLAAAALGSSSAALNQLERHRLRQSGGGTMARPADFCRTVFKRQPGAPRGKLRCVVSWIARTRRPATRAPNADPAAAKISSGITDRLEKNLPNATVPA